MTLAIAIVATAPGAALGSVTINVTYTGDNVVAGFYQDGSDPQAVAGFAPTSNWQSPQTMSVTLLPDHNDYQLIFRVYNDTTTQPSNSNPAGFLAQVTAQVAGQITSGADTLLTSSSWSYAVDPLQGVGDNTDWAALQWHSAETWAIGGNDASNGGNNIWSSVNGRPIAGISSTAQWIWGSKNGDGLFSNGVERPAELALHQDHHQHRQRRWGTCSRASHHPGMVAVGCGELAGNAGVAGRPADRPAVVVAGESPGHSGGHWPLIPLVPVAVGIGG